MSSYGFLFITVITPLHNGSGEKLGAIDRQIMRERTTGFPIIQSSSIKGVLRNAYLEAFDQDPLGPKKVFALFGPPPEASSDHSGALSFGDAQVLAFPVRSFKGAWVWITCPIILNRFSRQARVANFTINSLNTLLGQLHGGPQNPRICPSGGTPLLVNNQLLLEEFPLPVQHSSELADFASELAPIIYPGDTFLQSELTKKLVLLSEDDFTYFIKHATEVVPNIRIGKSGTTERGSLRYTEYLPVETILYTMVTCGPQRQPENDLNYYNGIEWVTGGIETIFKKQLPEFIQLGADETTGKGLVALNFQDNLGE